MSSKDESKYEIANILEGLSLEKLRIFSDGVLRGLKKGNS